MTAITSILLALYENMSVLGRHRRSAPSGQEVTVDREFPLDGQEVTVRATVTLGVEDDSDFNRESGYGAHTRVQVLETNITEVIDQDNVLVFGPNVDSLSDEQYLDLEAQVAEYAVNDYNDNH